MIWLACRVVTGKEYAIRKKITDLAPKAQIMVPRKYTKEIHNGVIKTRSERMLPGYLLVGTEEPINQVELEKFVRVLGPVSEDEMLNLMRNEGSKEDILGVGFNVLVIDGPFQGCRGKIQKQNPDGSVSCKIAFQSTEIFADMKLDLLVAANSSQ